MNQLISAAFSTLTTYEKSSRILLIATLCIIGIIAAIGLLIRFKNKDKLADFGKYTAGITVGYSISAICWMLFLYFEETIAEGDFNPAVFWPVCAFLFFVIALAIAALTISILKKSALRVFTVYAGAAAGIFAVVMLIVYLVKQYKEEFSVGNDLGLLFGALILVGATACIAVFFGKKTPENMQTKSIVYAAICIAMSFALSYMRLFRLPQGGSVTFASLLPLMFYSYIFGIRKGILAGIIYGLLQAIQDPWLLHPLQFVLDYPAAFMMIGLASLFKNIPYFKSKPVLGFIAGGIFVSVMRYACHVITGIIVFGSYAAEGFNAVSWGFVYNLFVFADAAIVIFAGAAMLSVNSFRKYMFSINPAPSEVKEQE